MVCGDSIYIKTKMGIITVSETKDPDYPGVYIDLHRSGCADMPLAIVECCQDEDRDDAPYVQTIVWGSGAEEDPTHKVKHWDVDVWFNQDDCDNRDKGRACNV